MAYLRYWRPFLPSLVSIAPRRPTRVILAMSRLATGEVEKACVRAVYRRGVSARRRGDLPVLADTVRRPEADEK